MANIYAARSDIATVWDGTVQESDHDRIDQLLVYAHALLRSKVRTIDDKANAGEVDTDLVQMLLVTAVIRVLNNPKGVLGAGTGETSYYYAQAGSDRYGGLYLDDDEITLLGVGTKSATRVASFRMASPYGIVRDEPWRY
ncbi:hypothetical protein [Kineosporia succinea]|uniref:Gp19/Gp15/Gp42-like protein n=1 Tax=Kineosporia succinea TaxID=84632 RepID=A0ABT9NXR7_9ACTN|nr:hypothetical protein [Kineosporia succinea]MDP9825223.1 hypothetical protein [Kineosporia succinea]